MSKKQFDLNFYKHLDFWPLNIIRSCFIIEAVLQALFLGRCYWWLIWEPWNKMRQVINQYLWLRNYLLHFLEFHIYSVTMLATTGISEWKYRKIMICVCIFLTENIKTIFFSCLVHNNEAILTSCQPYFLHGTKRCRGV